MFRTGTFVNCLLMAVALSLALSPSFAVAQGQYNFVVPLTIPGSGNFVADFNGDGKPDLLDSFGNLLLGNGEGVPRSLPIMFPSMNCCG